MPLKVVVYLETSGTCKHCGIHFEVRSDNPTMKCLYGAYPENPSEWVKEEARPS